MFSGHRVGLICCGCFLIVSALRKCGKKIKWLDDTKIITNCSLSCSLRYKLIMHRPYVIINVQNISLYTC